MERWIAASGDPVTLAIIAPTALPAPDVARHLRRGLRDIRDRAAREDPRWRSVAMAGMVEATGRALVLVRHPGLRDDGVAKVIARRWPTATFTVRGKLAPTFEVPVELALALAAKRRGVEPLRILVMPQRLRVQGAASAADLQRDALPFIVA